MQNARLDEAQAGIKIAGRNINNLVPIILWNSQICVPETQQGLPPNTLLFRPSVTGFPSRIIVGLLEEMKGHLPICRMRTKLPFCLSYSAQAAITKYHRFKQ